MFGARASRVSKPPAGSRVDPAHPLGSRLAGAWLFNEGSGVTVADVTGRGATASRQGSPGPAWQGGTRGWVTSVSNDSTQYWNVGTPPSIAVGREFTATVWVRQPVYASATCFAMTRDAPGDRGWCIGVDSAGKVYVEILGISIAGGAGPIIPSISGSFPSLRMLTITSSENLIGGGIQNVYVDGQWVASSGQSYSPTTAPLNFGRRAYGGFESPFQGLIDHGWIARGAFTGEQVRAAWADPYGMLVPPVPKRAWFGPAAAATGNRRRRALICGRN